MDLPVHGTGSSVRSYLYVTDVANAYILVLHKGQIGETYNIGTQKVSLHLSDLMWWFKAVSSAIAGSVSAPQGVHVNRSAKVPVPFRIPACRA